MSSPLIFFTSRKYKRRAYSDDHKIQDKLVFFTGEDEEEYLRCIPDGEYFIVNNIPFVEKGISFGDRITVVLNEVDNKLYFCRIEKLSQNSTIKINVLEPEYILITDELLKQKCKFVIYPPKGIICVSIPKNANYKSVVNLLQQGEREGNVFWNF